MIPLKRIIYTEGYMRKILIIDALNMFLGATQGIQALAFKETLQAAVLAFKEPTRNP